ncbi:hypothetical protein BJX96DRAFT_148695 [Aspergillus floccosus]
MYYFTQSKSICSPESATHPRPASRQPFLSQCIHASQKPLRPSLPLRIFLLHALLVQSLRFFPTQRLTTSSLPKSICCRGRCSGGTGALYATAVVGRVWERR